MANTAPMAIAAKQSKICSFILTFLKDPEKFRAWVDCIAIYTNNASPHKKVRYLLFFCLLGYTWRMITKQQAIELAGSQANLARLLGITRGAVWLWETIPQARIWQLKLLRPEWFMK